MHAAQWVSDQQPMAAGTAHREDGLRGVGDVLGEVLPPRLLLPDGHLLLDLNPQLRVRRGALSFSEHNF